MQKAVLSGLFLFLIIFPSYAFADGPYLNIPPTNAFDKIHSDNGTVTAQNFSMPLNIKGGSNCSVVSSNGTHTVTISCTATSTGSKGTYNQTLANNSVVNSGGYRINWINGTNNPVTVINDPSRSQVNVTINSGSGSSGVTSLNALTGALTIACVSGNTTCTTSGGNIITINTAYNIATLNLSETFSGTTTFNSAKLGGQFDLNNKTFKSLGHVYTWPNNTGTICLTNQTGSCGPGSSATYDTMQNVGTGEGSIYKGNSTNTNFQFKTLKQGSHITLTNNTNDVTIATTGLLSSALLSLNGDTTAAQVVASGNTNHITVTNAGANHSIDIAFKVNNATCSAGYFVSSYSNVTGIYTCSIGNVGTLTSLSNIGHGGQGFFSSLSGSIAQLRNLTSLRTDLFTIAKNTTDVTLSSSFKSNNISCSAGNAVTSFSNSTGTYTCSPFGSGTITGSQNVGHAANSVGVLSTPSSTTIKGRNMTGTSPITVTKTNDTDIAIGCSTCVTAAITSLNGQSGPSVNIVCQTGNTTCTNSTNQIQIGFGVNPVITGGAAQTITKRLTLVGDNQLVIQTTSGTPTVPSNAALYIANNDSSKFFIMDGYNGGGTHEPNYLLRDAGGSMASPTKTTIGLPLGKFGFGGYQQTTNAFTGTKALVEGVATQDWTSTANGAQLLFQTTPNGSSTLTTALILDSDQSATFANKLKFTPITDPTNLFTNAIWKSSTNADVLKYRNNANTTTYNILSTLGAVTTATPGNPATTTSTTAVMMGLAGSITPAVSTRIDVTICGQMANSVINDGATIQLRYGTGTAPTNAAALTGTQLGASQTLTEKVAAQNDGYCVTGIATGLTIGTAYWLDVALNAVTGGTASTTGITIKAHEI